jgi:hypothetical protein
MWRYICFKLFCKKGRRIANKRACANGKSSVLADAPDPSTTLSLAAHYCAISSAGY